MLTGRGWVVTVAGLVLLLGGWLLGIPELFALGIGALVLVVGAAVYVLVRFPPITAAHRLSVSRVRPGDASSLEITVINQGRRRTPLLLASDPVNAAVDRGRPTRYPDRLAIPPMAAGAAATIDLDLFTGQRGRWPIGPLAVGLGDRLGLVERLRPLDRPVTLTVFPRVDALRPLPAVARLASTGEHIGHSAKVDGGDELWWVRPYQDGDDLRHIHWASTASHDELMVRQGELPVAARLTLFGDFRSLRHDRASFEATLSVLASLAVSAWRSGSELRLISTAGFDSGWRSGDDQLSTALDALAGAEAHGSGAHGSGASGGGDGRREDPPWDGLRWALAALPQSGYGAAVVVTGASVDHRESASFHAALARFDPGVLVVLGPATPGAVRSRHPTTIRTTSSAFPAAWAQSVVPTLR